MSTPMKDISQGFLWFFNSSMCCYDLSHLSPPWSRCLQSVEDDLAYSPVAVWNCLTALPVGGVILALLGKICSAVCLYLFLSFTGFSHATLIFLLVHSQTIAPLISHFCPFSLCSMRDFPDTQNLSFCYHYNPTPIWITRSFPFPERDDSLFPGQCRGCLRRACRRVGRPVL